MLRRIAYNNDVKSYAVRNISQKIILVYCILLKYEMRVNGNAASVFLLILTMPYIAKFIGSDLFPLSFYCMWFSVHYFRQRKEVMLITRVCLSFIRLLEYLKSYEQILIKFDSEVGLKDQMIRFFWLLSSSPAGNFFGGYNNVADCFMSVLIARRRH